MSGDLGPLLLKSLGIWGWFILETFQGEHFLFDLVDMFLSYYETNLKKKRSVILWMIHAMVDMKRTLVLNRQFWNKQEYEK